MAEATASDIKTESQRQELVTQIRQLGVVKTLFGADDLIMTLGILLPIAKHYRHVLYDTRLFVVFRVVIGDKG